MKETASSQGRRSVSRAASWTQYVSGPVTGVIRIGPDLVVNSLVTPSSAVAGSTVSATDMTLNQGGDTAVASVTKYYLSVNSSIEPTDTLIGTRQVGSLTAGQSDTGSVSLTIPATVAAGNYWIIAKADGDNVIVEAAETNNTRVRGITISAAP